MLATLTALSALAHEQRLETFRLLVKAGPNGLTAGEIAATIGTPASTMSAHLSQLERAGLLTARRDKRHIIYAAHYDGVRALLAFLMEDCCQGRPEICAGLPGATAKPTEKQEMPI